MKGIRERQQEFSKKIKQKPEQNEARNALAEVSQPNHERPALQRRARELFQTSRADDTILMLRDALAAIVPAARGTPRHGLARRVIETALMAQGVHDLKLRIRLAAVPAADLQTRQPPRQLIPIVALILRGRFRLGRR